MYLNLFYDFDIERYLLVEKLFHYDDNNELNYFLIKFNCVAPIFLNTIKQILVSI